MKIKFTFLIFSFLFLQSLTAQNEWILHHPLTINTAPTGVNFDENSNITFISQGAGLFRVENGSNTLLSNAPVNSDLTTFQMDGQDIWVGGYGGGGKLSNGTWENFTPNNALQGFAIYDMDITNGAIWLAMENEGASYFNGTSWEHYNSSDGIAGNWHTCIAQNNNGEVYLGSSDWNNSTGIVNKFDGTNWTTIEVPGLSELTAIFIDNQDNVWVGGNGLLKYDGTSWTDYSSSLNLNQNIYSVNESIDGKIYFAGGDVVGFIENNTATLFDMPDNFRFIGRPNGIASDASGEVYFCMGPSNSLSTAQYGIYRYGLVEDFSIGFSENQLVGCPNDVFSIDLTIGTDFDSSAVLTVTAPYPISNSNPSPGDTITMTVTIPNNAAGNYTEMVSVTDGTNTTDRVLSYNIIGLPEATALQSPIDNEANVSFPVILDWDIANNANSYTLMVATDNNFSNVVINTELTDDSFTDAMSVLAEQTTYYWMVISNGDCGMASSSVLSFTTDQVSSTKFLNTQQMEIYPNPASDILYLIFDTPTSSAIQISMMTTDGKEVYQQKINEGTQQKNISIENMTKGLYFIKLTSHDEMFIKRIVIN